MDEIKRLTPAQRARCNRLIRRLCANYDGGNCLPLDDGEGCVCVQMISYSLLCKYFRRAVLPADKVLCADIYRQRTRTCERCGKPFAPSSNRQKYCPECGCSGVVSRALNRSAIQSLSLLICARISRIRRFVF